MRLTRGMLRRAREEVGHNLAGFRAMKAMAAVQQKRALVAEAEVRAFRSIVDTQDEVIKALLIKSGGTIVISRDILPLLREYRIESTSRQHEFEVRVERERNDA